MLNKQNFSCWCCYVLTSLVYLVLLFNFIECSNVNQSVNYVNSIDKREYDKTNNSVKFILQNYSRVLTQNHKQQRSLTNDDTRYANECGGVFRNVQTIIKSSLYPDNYPPNIQCKYIFMSPMACQTEFHIQFLDFSLESSPNCTKDKLHIGKSEILCGKVIGIMKYKTMDGYLKILFQTDAEQENRGFNLLITRLPCIYEPESTVYPVYEQPIEFPTTTEFVDVLDITTLSDETSTNIPTTQIDETVGLAKNHNHGIQNPSITKPIAELLPPLHSRSLNLTKDNQYLPYVPTINEYYPPSGSNQNCWHTTNGYLPPTNQYPFNLYPPVGNYPFGGNYPHPGNYPSTGNFPPTGQYPPVGSFPPVNNYPPVDSYPPSGYNPPSAEYPPSTNYQPFGGYPPIEYHPPGNNPATGTHPTAGTFPPHGYNPVFNGFPHNHTPTTSDVNPDDFPSTNSIPNPNYPNTIKCNPVYNQCPQINNNQTPYFPSSNSQKRFKIETQSQVYPSVIPRCCTRVFNQRRFYLSSPGFPSRNNENIDCLFLIERNNAGICRLRVDFRFFFVGTYSPQLGCLDNFMEIDGQRVCGCNTGLRYTSQWGIGAKVIRIRSRAVFAQNIRGFLLDIVQEDCPYRVTRAKQNINRSDEQPAILHSTVTQSNSSSLTTFYYYGNDNEIKPKETLPESKEQFDRRTESPASSQFFILNGFHLDRCSFSYGHWLKLVSDPLWLLRPTCS